MQIFVCHWLIVCCLHFKYITRVHHIYLLRLCVFLLQDKKSVESVCLCIARLVENFQSDQRLLKEIAAHGLLTQIQALVSISGSDLCRIESVS